MEGKDLLELFKIILTVLELGLNQVWTRNEGVDAEGYTFGFLIKSATCVHERKQMLVGSRAWTLGAHLAAFVVILISIFLVEVVLGDGIAKLTGELEEYYIHEVLKAKEVG